MMKGQARPRRSKLREKGTESLDARVGGWTREQLFDMDERFAEALRQAQRPSRTISPRRPPRRRVAVPID
jgi:hypothetical protein